MFSNYICALDLGSSKISAVLAKVKKGRITEIFFETANCKGMKHGAVVDSIELTGSIERLLKKIKQKAGANFRVVYVNISGPDIAARHSRAILPLAERGNKVITLSDIHKVNEQARILGSSLQEEIVHQIPFSYSVDGKDDIINPLGLYSHRLEADLYLISAKVSSVQNLNRVISQAGFEPGGVFFSGLSTSKVIFNKAMQQGLTVFCDVGSDITELLVFKDGFLKDIRILVLGGDSLTLELARQLKIPFELAEDLKRAHGSVGDYNFIRDDKEVLIKKENIYQPIRQKDISRILTHEAEIYCQAVKEQLQKLISGEHVDNFISVGRTMLLDGFLEMFETVLGTSVKIGRIRNARITHLLGENAELAGQKHLNYLTALGIICDTLGSDELPRISTAAKPSGNLLIRFLERAKEVYQEYF